MTSGVPKSGKRGVQRKNHSRWSKALLEPLYRSWLAGEDLRHISQHHGTTFGRLRSAFIYFGFDMSNLAHPVRSSLYGGARDPLAGLRQATRSEFEPTPRPYNPTTHRASRHYQGSFDL